MKTAYEWEEENGMIGKNPLEAMKCPAMPSGGAKASVAPDTHQRLLEASPKALRLLLTMLRETGCRPSEASRLTAQDVDFASGIAILSDHETSRKTSKPRLIDLTPKALGIVEAQAEAHPEGFLFRNAFGREWTKDGIGQAMRKTGKKAGVKAIAYGYRHAFATDALAQGVPDATVAALLSGVPLWLHKLEFRGSSSRLPCENRALSTSDGHHPESLVPAHLAILIH